MSLSTISAILAACLLPAIGHAGSLKYLVPFVDVIVDGSATDRSGANGNASLHGERKIQILPKRVYKGDAPGTIDATWFSTWDSLNLKGAGISGGSNALPPAEGLWLLKKSSNGVLEIVAAYGGQAKWSEAYFRLSPQLPDTLQMSTGSLVDELVLQIAAGEAADTSEESVGQTRAAVGGSDSPAVRAALQYLVQSPRTRAQALQGLMFLSDEGAFNSFVNQIHTLTQPELAGFSLVLETGFRSTSEAVIATLGELAFDRNTPDAVRPGAAEALSAIHTRSTLPYIAQLLESSDLVMRQKAAFGLSAFANGLPIMTPDGLVSGKAYTPDPNGLFKTEDTMRYFALPAGLTYDQQEPAVKFWRTWWQTHRVDLGF